MLLIHLNMHFEKWVISYNPHLVHLFFIISHYLNFIKQTFAFNFIPLKNIILIITLIYLLFNILNNVKVKVSC